MTWKNLILSSLIILLLLICIGGVSAEENSTQSIELEEIEDIKIENTNELLKDSNESSAVADEKKDPDFTISFDEEYIENSWDRSEGPFLFIYPTYENMTGNFTVYLDNKKINFGEVDDFKDPSAEIPAPFYKLGDHTIKVKYSGDDSYKPLTKTHIFSVKKAIINMINGEYVLGSDDIGVKLVPDATGTITLYINGIKKKTIKVTPLDSEAADVGFSNNIPIELDKFITFGKSYNVTVTFSGKVDGKTLKESKTGTITSVTYPLEINVYDYYYGHDSENIFEISTPNDMIKNNLNVFINGEKVPVCKMEDSDYWTYYVNTTDFRPGKYTIEVNYTGDDKYPSKSVNSTFEIFADIIISDYEIPYNSSIDVELTLSENAEGNLTVYIAKTDKIYEIYDSQALKNGYAKVNIKGDHIGKYYIKAEYDGDYPIENVTDYSIEIHPIITIPESMVWGDDKYITIKTDKEANGTLYFYRMWKPYRQVDVVNGSAKISLADLPSMTYYEGETSITYKNSEYEYEPWEYLLFVKPKFTLTGPSSMYYADSATYSVKVFGLNGKILKEKYVTFKIGKTSVKVKTNSKGIAKLKVPNTVTPGKYTVKVIYNGFSTSKKLTVKQVLTLKAVKVKKSAKKLVLTATLKNKKVIKNKQVTFKFNGKTYKTKTNSKGIAKVTIKSNILKKLKVGKKITYHATYVKDTVKKTVKIKK